MSSTDLSSAPVLPRSVLDRWFPVPHAVSPSAVGIDTSDASIKWLALAPGREAGREVISYGLQPLRPGIIESGVIHDKDALAAALAEVKKKLPGIHCAHAALPEEAAYVFNMHVPDGTPRDQVLRLIEFEFEGRVPLPPSDTIYDYEVIKAHVAEGMEIGVVVFPREVCENYAAVFQAAGFTLLSLEIEARSIARAVIDPHGTEPVMLLVDFGRARTGFAVLQRGIPIFTSTVMLGGEAITRSLMEKASLSAEDAERFKDNEGLVAGKEHKDAVAAVQPSAEALAEEIARHFHFWDTRRNERGERVTPVGRVLLVGGSSNLKGLADFVATKIRTKTERPNIWGNICSFETYIPPIDRRDSLEYATAAGLALRDL